MRKVPLLLAVVCLTALAPAYPSSTQHAVYRSGKGAWGYVDFDQDALGAGRFEAFFIEPVRADAVGYASGAGTVATSPGPGQVDLSRPWIAFTRFDRPSFRIACHAVLNAPPGYLNHDSAPVSAIDVTVPCNDGVNSSYRLLWYRTAGFDRFAFSFLIGDIGAQPWGDLTVHMLDADAVFGVCGDVTGCIISGNPGSYWRIYDATVALHYD